MFLPELQGAKSFTAINNGQDDVVFELYRYKAGTNANYRGMDMYVHTFGDKWDSNFPSVCSD